MREDPEYRRYLLDPVSEVCTGLAVELDARGMAAAAAWPWGRWG